MRIAIPSLTATIIGTIIASVAATIASAAPEPIACELKETSDGFVALRSGPSAKTRLVARMKPNEVIAIERTESLELVMRGKWAKAEYFPGEEMPNPGEPGSEKIRRGWVNFDLIDGCDA
jgi:polynucleotide 5'-kinase involved in rRNA processing